MEIVVVNYYATGLLSGQLLTNLIALFISSYFILANNNNFEKNLFIKLKFEAECRV